MMDIEKLIETLKDLEACAYGYHINGEVLGMDCSDFEQVMVDAAEEISEISTLRAENEQLRAELEQKSKLLAQQAAELERRDKLLKEQETELERVKRERSAAAEDLRVCSIENRMECQYCLYRTARSFCWDCTDGSNWQWRGHRKGGLTWNG